MKRLTLTILCLVMAVLSVAAQTQEEGKTSLQDVITSLHLKFMGIPIFGTPDEFGKKLSEVGFLYDRKFGNALWYKGSFAGYYNCEVAVKYAVKYNKDFVYEVVVIFPEAYSWNHLYDTYSSLKTKLSVKYGEPIDCKESFKNTPSYMNINDDNDKFREVKNKHCVYYSSFKGERGTISLEIKSTCCVGLHYTDSINFLLKESSAIDDL